MLSACNIQLAKTTLTCHCPKSNWLVCSVYVCVSVCSKLYNEHALLQGHLTRVTRYYYYVKNEMTEGAPAMLQISTIVTNTMGLLS